MAAELPWLLYLCGNSMHQISHGDFSLLEGRSSGEKDSNCPLGIHAISGTHCISTSAPLLVATATTSTYTASTVNHLLPEPIGTNSALRPRLRPTIHDHAIGICADNSPSITTGIKLDEQLASDLFPSHASTWHHHPLNNYEQHRSQPQENHNQPLHSNYRLMNTTAASSKLLLQGSDDPLISRGATSVSDDDPPAEFNTLVALQETPAQPPPIRKQTSHHSLETLRTQPYHSTSSLDQQRHPSPSRTTNGCSSLTKQQLKIKATRMSHSNQAPIRAPPAAGSPKSRPQKSKKKPGTVKLRFHHQALPAEYLSHYEATQTTGSAKNDVAPAKATAEIRSLPPPKSANENVRSWLQKIAELHRASQQPHEPKSVPDRNNNQTNVASVMTESVVGMECSMETPKVHSKASTTPTQPKRMVNYSDLPYMGEITLDHSKPKRGRKPKKADICHLIYKNYGTILPGTPKSKLNKSLMEPPTELKLTADEEAGGGRIEAAEERKPHQLLKRETINRCEEAPLNLCLRDQSTEDFYSISEDEEEEDNEKDDCNESSRDETPLISSVDVANDRLLAANLRFAMPGILQEEPKASLPQVHPISLYYQKLIESGTLVSSREFSDLGFPVETIQRDNQLALKIPIPSGLFLTPKKEKASPLAPSAGSPTDFLEPMSTPSSLKSENSTTSNMSSPAVQVLQLPLQAAPKRKRSAIYIPPLAVESPNTPSNEVSICKFKFTGGARPTLQEKKMLSVDACGNYRYYSGSGDKSGRSCEFFPRESVQMNGGVLPGVNCAHAGGGERMVSDIPPPSAGLSNELLQIPDSPTGNMLMLTGTGPASMPTAASARPASPLSAPGALSPLDTLRNPRPGSSTSSSNEPYPPPKYQQQKHHFGDRKKKSRRSVQREKLEKTFKEKGFLIQTQQLESAEGATYCKFRQLKKFTRYLFRSWKDYLPDELQQANEAAAACVAAAALNQHQLHHNQQRSASTAKLPESVPATGSQPANPVIENLLASHGFAVAQVLPPCMLQERLVEDSRRFSNHLQSSHVAEL